MARVFKMAPKREKRANGLILTTSMVAIVTTKSHTSTPFYNGAVELKETYMRLYGLDLKKLNANAGDFDFKVEG
ncbi:MAG: DUF6140 family protein [Rikenellaceae bacterium]